MRVKISQDGHVIMPAHLLEEFGLGPGDTLELTETDDGFALKLAEKYIKPPRRPIDLSKLGTLSDKIPPDTPPLDMELFRECLRLDREKYREKYLEKYGDLEYDPAKYWD